MGQGPTPFFNRRRIDGLTLGTPRHMPVPAKELDVLLREIYSFGGPGRPDMSVRGPTLPNMSVIGGAPTVRDIWEQYRALARASGSRLH